MNFNGGLIYLFIIFFSSMDHRFLLPLSAEWHFGKRTEGGGCFTSATKTLNVNTERK